MTDPAPARDYTELDRLLTEEADAKAARDIARQAATEARTAVQDLEEAVDRASAAVFNWLYGANPAAPPPPPRCDDSNASAS
jgi:hypothetical protein